MSKKLIRNRRFGKMVFFRISKKKKEVEEILWTYSNRSFLKKYVSGLILPEFSASLKKKLIDLKSMGVTEPIRLSKNTRSLFLKEFRSLYSVGKYKSVTDKVEKKWRKIERSFFEEIVALSIPELRLRNRFFCYITFYGGGGSYGRDNQIYVRANPDIPNDFHFVNYTIMHELIYLMFEPFVQKKNLPQLDKEKFVESVVEKPQILKLLK